MDIGNIKESIIGMMGKDMVSNLPLDKILQGVLDKTGIKMEESKVKEIADNPIVKNIISKAVAAITGAQKSGQDVSAAADAPLGTLADKIVEMAPGASKSDLVDNLKSELMGKLGQ